MRKNKKFDCVKMMREIRNEVDAEISKMTPNQILEYLKKGRNEYEETIAKH